MRFQNAPMRASPASPLALGFSHQHHTTWADRHGLQSTRRVAPGPLGASPCGPLPNDVVAGAMTAHVQSRSKAFNVSRSMATNPLPPLNAFERSRLRIPSQARQALGDGVYLFRFPKPGYFRPYPAHSAHVLLADGPAFQRVNHPGAMSDFV